jgi:formylglycine-generating enzyme required for sulfatase activity
MSDDKLKHVSADVFRLERRIEKRFYRGGCSSLRPALLRPVPRSNESSHTWASATVGFRLVRVSA